MHAEVKLYLDGMYCGECKNIIAAALQNTSGIINADVSYARSCADITYDDEITDIEKVKRAIERAGYSATENRKNVCACQFISLLLIAVLVFLFREIFSHGMMPSVRVSMSYGFIFIIGLTTSFHCIGMCGGIMLSQTAVPDNLILDSKARVIVPAASYNAGRIISYTLVGAIVGAVGSVISVKASAKSMIFIIIGVLMVLIAFQMMHIIPRFEKMSFSLPQSCQLPQNTRKKFATKPLIIGLLTGLMPCGALQSMQLYALSTGSAVSGAAVMFFFSIGTVPLLLLLGGLSTLASKKFQKYMVRISGILIATFSILLIWNGIGIYLSGGKM